MDLFENAENGKILKLNVDIYIIGVFFSPRAPSRAEVSK